MVLRAGESKTAEACADLRIDAAASRRICARVFLRAVRVREAFPHDGPLRCAR
jgi:hypothetical protein